MSFLDGLETEPFRRRSLTHLLDRPVTGRVFFEEVIRENFDIGRPGQVQLIFDRRVSRRTPAGFVRA